MATHILAYVTSFVRSAATRALITTALIAPFSLSPAAPIGQNSSDIHRGDNSDWWSNRRTLESDNSIKTEEQDPPEKHLQISVVRLRDDMFTIATTHFGKTPLISRGDAATSRDQLCYVSKDKPKIHLVLEETETTFAFYLFEGGPAWDTSGLCAPSPLINETLATLSLLHLGQLDSQVLRILGPPTNRRKNEFIYSYHVEKTTTPEDLKLLREKYPQMTEKDFHANYDFHDLTAGIRARFKNSRLIYLSATRAETD